MFTAVTGHEDAGCHANLKTFETIAKQNASLNIKYRIIRKETYTFSIIEHL